jgi:WD40 repeat protein/DNA-directed RNA polymerase subunit RPC12/RpoP
LQRRLVRRGVTLSAALTLLALSQQTAAAAAPPLLVQATVSGLATTGAGKAAAALSPAALNLAQGVLRTVALTKIKVMTTVLLALSVAVGGATVATNQGSPPAPVALPAAPAPARTMLFVPPAVPFPEAVDEQVLAVAFSPDGSRLVTAGGRHVHPGQIKFWDVVGLRELTKLRRTRGNRIVAFSPDGQTLACGEFGGTITLRDGLTGEPQAVLRGHQVGVNSLAFSADGTLLVSGGLDHIVKIWDVKSRTEKAAFSGHTEGVYGVAFYHRQPAVVSGGNDKTARVWDLRTGEQKLLLSHPAVVEQVAVSPDDKVIACACWDSTIRVWDAETGAERGVLTQPAPAYAVAYAADGTYLASGSATGEVRLWEAKTQKLVAVLGRQDAPVWSLAFSPGGKLLASGGSDTSARLWDLTTKKERAKLATCALRPISALAYSPDGKTVAIATDEKLIRLHDARTGAFQRGLSGHTEAVTCLAYSPDGRTLASGSQDRTVQLWDCATGLQQRVLDKDIGLVHSLAFSPDGKRLASAGQQGVVCLWDSEKGNLVASHRVHHGPIYSLAFSPTSELLASGGADKAVVLWNPEGSAPPVRLERHQGSVRALVFAGQALVSGGEQGELTIWEPADGGSLLTAKRKARDLPGPIGDVTTLAFSEQNDLLVGGGSQGGVMQWHRRADIHRGWLGGTPSPRITALAVHPSGTELLTGNAAGQVLRYYAQGAFRPALAGGGNVPPRAEPPPVELKEFYQDFRDSKNYQPPLQIFGARAQRVCRPEPSGFHIRVSANPEQTQRIGLLLPARIRGDFEITAAYEIARVDQPRDGHGVGVCLLADLDSPRKEVLEVTRGARVTEGQSYWCCRATLEGGKMKYELQFYPTMSMTGHLRLTRRGGELICSVRDGGATQFTILRRLPCGTEDIKQVRFGAFMGFAPNDVDLYLKDLRIGPPDSGQLTVAEPSEPRVEGMHSGQRGFLWIVAGMLTAFLMLAAGLGLLLARRRKRRQAGDAKAQPTASELPPNVTALSCLHCGARLRLRGELAGKQVKCPRCGSRIAVPQTTSSSITPAK